MNNIQRLSQNALGGLALILAPAAACSNMAEPSAKSSAPTQRAHGHTGPTQFGAHVGAGCNGRAAVATFEAFAGRKLERTVDAIDQQDWKSIRSSAGWLSHCWSGAPLKLTVSVPMIPNGTQSSLAQGASGAYDDVFRDIAARLVQDKLSDATIRLGWEFNGDWMPWTAAKDPASYITFFRRIVGVMRAVPNQHFLFEWTPGIGQHAIAPDRAYPGDDVVDVIGMDIYNEWWSPQYAAPQARFAWLRDQPYGLAWLSAFAAAHRKPTAYSEWGSGTRPDGHGGGDDPYFITQMAAWFAATHPLYQSYWEVSDPGQYDDTLAQGRHPRAAAAFKAAFGSVKRVPSMGGTLGKQP
jgi:hypothetical protein